MAVQSSNEEHQHVGHGPMGLSHLRLPVGRGILNMFAIGIFRRIYMMSLFLSTAQKHKVRSHKRNILSGDINLINADTVS